MDEMPTLKEDELRKGFQIGPWRVFPEQNLLSGASREIHLEPRVMEVLVYLAARQGEVIKRDQLIDAVWKTVVTDEVLSRAISLLRTSLDDDHKVPRYIQTIPRTGYRFIHEVQPLPATTAVPFHGAASAFGLSPGRLLLGAVVLVSAVMGFFAQMQDSAEPAARASVVNPVDWLTTLEKQRQVERDMTSIAILPFDNLSEDSSYRYISDSLTDEVTMSLARLKGLRVVARRSSYSFRNRVEDIPSIGKLLKVDAVLEGSVRKNGDQLKINAQLSSVSDGYLLWTQSYARSLEDVFEVRGDIAAAVVQALRSRTAGGDDIQAPEEVAPPNMEAYGLYLNGRFLWKLRGEQALKESIEKFRQAVSLDPDFVKAWLGLANSLVLMPFYTPRDMDDMFEQASAILDRIEPVDAWEQGEAEAIRGFIAMYHWRWAEAELHLRKAVELAPDNPNTFNWYSQFFSMVGRVRDSVTAAERGKDLDSVSPVINNRLAVAYLWVDDNVRAAEQFSYGSHLGFSNQLNPAYIIFLLREKRYQELELVLANIHADSGDTPDWLLQLGYRAFLPENRQKVVALATGAGRELPQKPNLQFGFWVLLGAIDQAYQNFYQYADGPERLYLYPEFLFSREAADFRRDPRFRELTRKIGLEEYWVQFGGPDYLRPEN